MIGFPSNIVATLLPNKYNFHQQLQSLKLWGPQINYFGTERILHRNRRVPDHKHANEIKKHSSSDTNTKRPKFQMWECSKQQEHVFDLSII